MRMRPRSRGLPLYQVVFFLREVKFEGGECSLEGAGRCDWRGKAGKYDIYLEGMDMYAFIWFWH